MSAPEPPPEPARHLTPDEVRAELAHIKPGVRSPLRDAIAGHAARSGQEAAELLNEAVKRALSSRAIPADVPFDAVLAEIARSIASSANLSRSRARQRIVDLPIQDLLDIIPAGGYAVSSPDDVIEQERARQICADALDRLAANDEKRAALIDAIDQGKRGDDLAATIGITKRELATLRKALKREVKRLWPEVQDELGEE